jgi:hypothetical protein
VQIIKKSPQKREKGLDFQNRTLYTYRPRSKGVNEKEKAKKSEKIKKSVDNSKFKVYIYRRLLERRDKKAIPEFFDNFACTALDLDGFDFPFVS